MHGIKPRLRSALLGVFVGVTAHSGWAVDASQMGFSELVTQAEVEIEAGNSSQAIPLLLEIITRAGGLTDKNAQRSVQMARLQVASSYLQQSNWLEAKRFGEEYFTHKPMKDEHGVLTVLCESSLRLKEWGPLLTYAEQLVEESDTLKKRAPAHQYLLRAYFYNKKYPEALDVTHKLLDWVKDPQQRLAVRGMQIECMVETGQMNEIMELLPELFAGGDRSDVRLNLTLLGIADKLFDRGEHRNALAIYRQILPWVKPMLYNDEIPFDLGEIELSELAESISTMKSGAEYDMHVSYRSAQSYAEVKRYWEAINLFDQTFRDHIDKREGKGAFFQKIQLLFDLGENKQAVQACEEYLDTGRSGFFARMMCTLLAQHYLNAEEFDKVLALDRYVTKWGAPADDDEREQATNLLYIFAFVRLQRHELVDAVNWFERVIDYDPRSERSQDSHYWIGMCRLLEQGYSQALADFQNYRNQWPNGSFAAAALFRMGTCYFGLEQYEEAQDTFARFIEAYPHDELMAESLTMYADLLGADGELDEALSNYKRAMETVQRRHQFESNDVTRKGMVTAATYASIQAAKTLEQDAKYFLSERDKETAFSKYREIIEWMNTYMDLFGQDADIAQAVYWVGRSEMALGEKMKAVDAYYDAVLRFGDQANAEGVASILFELAGVIDQQLNVRERTKIINKITKDLDEQRDPILKIRLEVLLAELNDWQADFGQELLTRNLDWNEVPPTGLGLIGDAMVSNKQYAKAQPLFDYFNDKYDTSPYMVSAYHLLADAKYAEGDYDRAYDLAGDALGYYGATGRTGWAQLMKGKIESMRGDHEAAAKTFNAIFGVRAWRGEIAAEGMFSLAEAWEAQGNLEKAFAFYQRTYLLYRAYGDGSWAANGYLRSADVLKKLNRPADVSNTYRAMLLDKYVQNLPQAQVAKKALGPVETEELLSGITNNVQKVSLRGGQ